MSRSGFGEFKTVGGYGYRRKKYTIVLPYKIVLQSLFHNSFDVCLYMNENML